MGSPEGELALAEAVVYLAVAAKSNAVYSAWGEPRVQRSRRGIGPEDSESSTSAAAGRYGAENAEGRLPAVYQRAQPGLATAPGDAGRCPGTADCPTGAPTAGSCSP